MKWMTCTIKIIMLMKETEWSQLLEELNWDQEGGGSRLAHAKS
jgi:hypothetical protein